MLVLTCLCLHTHTYPLSTYSVVTLLLLLGQRKIQCSHKGADATVDLECCSPTPHTCIHSHYLSVSQSPEKNYTHFSVRILVLTLSAAANASQPLSLRSTVANTSLVRASAAYSPLRGEIHKDQGRNEKAAAPAR
jgi:hypothetical protein